MLGQSLALYTLSLDSLSKEQIDTALAACKLDTIESLLEEIGLGQRPPNSIAKLLAAKEGTNSDLETAPQVKNQQNLVGESRKPLHFIGQ